MRIMTVDDMPHKNTSIFLFFLVFVAGIMGIVIGLFGLSALPYILFVFAGLYAIINPWHGFLATVFFLPFTGLYFDWLTGAQLPVQIIPSQFLGMLTLIGYLLRGKRLTFTRHDKALFVFFVIAIFTSIINYPKIIAVNVTFFGGIFRNPGGRCFAQIVVTGLMISLYLLTVNILTTQQRLNMALKLFLGSLFITSIFAIYQFIGHFFGSPLTNFTYYPALGKVLDARVEGVFARVGSFSGEPRHLSYNLLPGIFILFPLAVFKPYPFKSKFVPFIFLLCLFTAFIFTFSRSGWVSFTISFLVCLVLMNFYPAAQNHKQKKRSGKKWLGILATLVLFPVFFVVLNKIISVWGYSLWRSVFERFSSIEKLLTAGYIENVIMKKTLALITNNFLWGVGFGNSSFYIDVRPIVDVTGTYLRLLSETGIFGLLAFLCFLCSILIYSIRAMAKMSKEGDRIIIVALLAGTLSFLINWIHYGQDFINPLIWILLGMLKVSAKLGLNVPFSIKKDA